MACPLHTVQYQRPERVYLSQKYTYKLCPFKDAKQDYTNLGKWQGWGNSTSPTGEQSKDYSKMQFSKGQRCWNGPERSVAVTVECGAVDEILSVDEPSTCVYQMHAQTYVACTAQALAKAKDEVAFWSK